MLSNRSTITLASTVSRLGLPGTAHRREGGRKASLPFVMPSRWISRRRLLSAEGECLNFAFVVPPGGQCHRIHFPGSREQRFARGRRTHGKKRLLAFGRL